MAQNDDKNYIKIKKVGKIPWEIISLVPDLINSGRKFFEFFKITPRYFLPTESKKIQNSNLFVNFTVNF